MGLKLKVKLLNEMASLPAYSRKNDACMDICACENTVLKPGEYKAVATGLAFSIPKRYVCFVLSRSGLAAKSGISVLNAPGVLDYDYRGEIKVILINNSLVDFVIEPKMRIAQIGLYKAKVFKTCKVFSLNETLRAGNGLGSSGLKNNKG